MRSNFFRVAIFVTSIFLVAPNTYCKSSKGAVIKPDDYTVSLDLKFSRKKANAIQRIFSFLDYGPNGFATGFVVADRLVMTAYHVVSGDLSDSKKVQLGFAPGDELAVEIYITPR
jgi:hypothetical protein